VKTNAKFHFLQEIADDRHFRSRNDGLGEYIFLNLNNDLLMEAMCIQPKSRMRQIGTQEYQIAIFIPTEIIPDMPAAAPLRMLVIRIPDGNDIASYTARRSLFRARA
jgi:hypothetical protein